MWDLRFHLQVVQFLHWLHEFYVRSFDVYILDLWWFLKFLGWVMICCNVKFKLTQVHAFVFTYWASDQWDAGMLFVASVSKFASSLLMVDAVLVYTFHDWFEVLDFVVWRIVCCKVWLYGLGQLWRWGGVVLFCRGNIIVVVVESSWVESMSESESELLSEAGVSSL